LHVNLCPSVSNVGDNRFVNSPEPTIMTSSKPG
jgi:hypothetical protein